MKAIYIVVVAVTMWVTGTEAVAQPGAIPTTPVAEAPPVEPEESSVPAGILEDAHSGRAVLAPTALMAPKGTCLVSSYEIVGLGGACALTDWLQLSVLATPPIYEALPISFTAKAGFPIGRRFYLGAHTTLITVFGEEGSGVAGLFGGFATLCLSRDCHSYANGYLGTFFTLGDGDQEQISVASGAVVFGVTKRFKLAFEVNTAHESSFDDDRISGLWYGARYASSRFSVDLGFAQPLFEDEEFSSIGLPWVALSYRKI